MQARAVESEIERDIDVFLHGGEIGRGIYTVGIIALIEHELLKDGSFVQDKFHAFIAHFAQAEIGKHFVAFVNDAHIV